MFINGWILASVVGKIKNTTVCNNFIDVTDLGYYCYNNHGNENNLYT